MEIKLKGLRAAKVKHMTMAHKQGSLVCHCGKSVASWEVYLEHRKEALKGATQ